MRISCARSSGRHQRWLRARLLVPDQMCWREPRPSRARPLPAEPRRARQDAHRRQARHHAGARLRRPVHRRHARRRAARRHAHVARSQSAAPDDVLRALRQADAAVRRVRAAPVAQPRRELLATLSGRRLLPADGVRVGAGARQPRSRRRARVRLPLPRGLAQAVREAAVVPAAELALRRLLPARAHTTAAARADEVPVSHRERAEPVPVHVACDQRQDVDRPEARE